MRVGCNCELLGKGCGWYFRAVNKRRGTDGARTAGNCQAASGGGADLLSPALIEIIAAARANLRVAGRIGTPAKSPCSEHLGYIDAWRVMTNHEYGHQE